MTEANEDVRQFVKGLNGIDKDMIDELMTYDEFDWEEVTVTDSYDGSFEYGLPMRDTMYSFDDSWFYEYWLEEKNGIEIMSEIGFKIFHSGKYGYFFGINTYGCSFYEDYWIPLYEAIYGED